MYVVETRAVCTYTRLCLGERKQTTQARTGVVGTYVEPFIYPV